MKKLILILVLALTVYTVYSQPGSKGDTCVCVTPQEIRSANQTYDTLQITKAVIHQQETVIRDMKSLASISDSVIKKQIEIHLNDADKISNLGSRDFLLTRANVLLLDQNNLLKSDKKRLKKKLGWLTGLSTAVIGGLVYLLVK